MHIFDVLQNRTINLKTEARKIKWLLKEEDYFVTTFSRRHSLFETFDYLFRKLPIVGNFISLHEFLMEQEFDSCDDLEEFSLLCEKVLTLLYQCKELFKTTYKLDLNKFEQKEKEIKKVIDFDLSKLSLKTETQETEFGKLIVIYPNDVTIIKAIEANPELTECIIEYSRPSNKGNLVEKEKNLHFIIKGVEHIAQNKNFKYPDICEQAETIFNMFHIRHDNIEGKKKNKILPDLNDQELEEVFDMGYQLALELLILDEFASIDTKINKLRKMMK